MTFRKNLRIAVISLGASLLASQAHAIAISDATIQNPTGGLDSSSATAQGQGKIKNANINALTGLFAGDEWSLLDRTNKPSTPLDGVNYLLSANTGQRTGEWGVSWAGSDVPAYMDYVLVLKSGKKWSAYLFESANLSSASQDIGGTFGISWLNKKGKIPKLRHASIFGRVGEAPAGPDDGTDGPGDGTGGPGDGTGGPGDGTGGPGDGTGGPGDGAGGPGDGTGGPGDGTGGPGDDTGGLGDEVVGPNADVPTPGSLALLTMGLGLVLLQLRQRSRN